MTHEECDLLLLVADEVVTGLELLPNTEDRRKRLAKLYIATAAVERINRGE